MDSYETFLSWYTSDIVDEPTKEELFSISRNRAEIEERFYQDLTFGTAGLRGIIGAGTNRMNRYVVRRATQGLADYINAHSEPGKSGVCIAFDSRRLSTQFAEETACVLARNGIHVFLFESLRPVPMLSFTMRNLNCIAGVVITASHNPKEYNGYKVYASSGGQVPPDAAASIFACIQKIEMFHAKTMHFIEAKKKGLITIIGRAEDEVYYAANLSLLTCPRLMAEKGRARSVVYTPLNGSGSIPVRTLLHRAGVLNVTVVPEQEMPNPDFPTVTAPNPEDPAAFTLAQKLAKKVNASVCLATDPDADRLGVSVRDRFGNWRVLTGNQIGSLLLYHILSAKAADGTLPNNGAVVKSVVSTRLADAICAHFSVSCEDVLTGFRFIADRIAEYERTGEKTFLFGFEESFGFLAGGLARDKDAVSSAMLIAEMCVLAHEEGKTLSDKLDELYASFGYYKERVKSYTLAGKAGLEKIASAMAALHRRPLSAAANVPVSAVDDFLLKTRTFSDGHAEPLALPSTDMLRFTLENGAWIVVRPSGTEPKLKLYIGANAPAEAETDALLLRLMSDVDAQLVRLLE